MKIFTGMLPSIFAATIPPTPHAMPAVVQPNPVVAAHSAGSPPSAILASLVTPKRRMGGILTVAAPALLSVSCETPSAGRYGIYAVAAVVIGGFYLLMRRSGQHVAQEKINRVEFEELRERFHRENVALAMKPLSETVETLKRLIDMDTHDTMQFISSPRLYQTYTAVLGEARATCRERADAALGRLNTTTLDPVDATRMCSDEIAECIRGYLEARAQLQDEILIMIANPDEAIEHERQRQWSAHNLKMHSQFNEILLRARPRKPGDLS